MAVQAHHLNTNTLFFPTDQLSRTNWESVMLPITDQSIDIPYSTQLGGGLADLLYSSCSSVVAPASAEYPITTETATRKRARDESCFRTEDLSSEILSQQLELDRLVAHHMEKVRWEVAETRRRQWRAVVEAAEEGLTRRLRAKEEELEAMARLSRVLEERVRSLALENQIWRELAQSNEAAVQALQSDLAQAAPAVAEAEDGAESCCGAAESGGWERRCRACDSGESCVLLLPCRHLCACGPCEATLQACPVCNSDKLASVHVNMS